MSTLHLILFPFMSKGHTIPMLHLALHLLRRGLSITIFTTPANSLFLRRFLASSDSSAAIIELPFPTIYGIPAGIESTDHLPSINLFPTFIQATKQLQEPFEVALHQLQHPISCIISDGFLPWTLQSANIFRIPRLVFYGFGAFPMTVSRYMFKNRPEKIPFSIPGLSSLQLTKTDVSPPLEASGFFSSFLVETVRSCEESWGILVNSFHDLEPTYVDHWNDKSEINFKPKAWCIGPLCLTGQRKSNRYSAWLDEMLRKGRCVIYVAFGSQADLSEAQLCEIALGLEESEQGFMWVVRNKEWDLPDGFEERVGERGVVVREWVEQQEVLGHGGVHGFLSHCGWNSVLESVCEGVPILAWPMMADQYLNAKLVVEELGVGLRMPNTGPGGVDGCVGRAIVADMVRELMVEEKGREPGKRAGELGRAARNAMEEGGSSWLSLNQLVYEISEGAKTRFPHQMNASAVNCS